MNGEKQEGVRRIFQTVLPPGAWRVHFLRLV
jgi:hypothetical protein